MARQSEFERSAVMNPIVIREHSEIDSAQPLTMRKSATSKLARQASICGKTTLAGR